MKKHHILAAILWLAATVGVALAFMADKIQANIAGFTILAATAYLAANTRAVREMLDDICKED